MFLGRNLELILGNVVPDDLLVIPICEDTVCNGIHQCEDTALTLRLVHVSRGSGGKQRTLHWATSPAINES